MSKKTFTKAEISEMSEKVEEARHNYQYLDTKYSKERRQRTVEHDAAVSKHEANVRSCQERLYELENTFNDVVASVDNGAVILYKNRLVVNGTSLRLTPDLTTQIFAGGEGVSELSSGKMFFSASSSEGSATLVFDPFLEAEYEDLIKQIPDCVARREELERETAAQIGGAREDLARAIADTAEIEAAQAALDALSDMKQEVDDAERKLDSLSEQYRSMRSNGKIATILRAMLGVTAFIAAALFLLFGVAFAYVTAWIAAIVLNSVLIFVFVFLGMWAIRGA
jgi:hypothetical protein